MFVRTKDGIYEVEQTLVNGVNLKCKPKKYSFKINVYIHPFVSNEEIVKQAENIEELCDKYVIFDKCSVTPHIRTSFKEVKSYKSMYDKVDKNFINKIYGAIWTEKGLIYVAKMNDKGELELL